MNINFRLKIISTLILVGVYFFAYYLLTAKQLGTSIHAIVAYSHQLDVKKHLIVLGLLPIYIATIIFGAGTLAFCLKSALEHFFSFRKYHFSSVKKLIKYF